jgi:uncharacterized tellurite resistance protein B-like protein
MKTEAFQQLLLKSAVSVMACDGSIDTSEVEEIRKIADNEIYFMGFEYEQLLTDNLNHLKQNGNDSIKAYFSELENASLSKSQGYLLFEVLIRVVESDQVIDETEKRFLNLVKVKLDLSEEELLERFPTKMNYLLNFNTSNLSMEFLP